MVAVGGAILTITEGEKSLDLLILDLPTLLQKQS